LAYFDAMVKPMKGISRLSSQSGGGTLADRTYQALRDGIALGRLLPGERITERALAADLGVSPTPVREAMRRLEQERLIERTGPKTVRVSRPTSETLRELAYAEAVVRGVAARFAAKKLTGAEIAELEELISAMAVAFSADDAVTALPFANRFNEIIQQACRNDIITSLAANITAFGPGRRQHALTEMVRHDQATLRRRLDDHRNILAALKARDADQAEALMRQHVLDATEYFMNFGG
jgi:DNA-binding GntR family transcriptional regulator